MSKGGCFKAGMDFFKLANHWKTNLKVLMKKKLKKLFTTSLLPVLVLAVSPMVLAYPTYYYNNTIESGSTDKIRVPHDKTIYFWIECKPISGKKVPLFVNSWHYDRSSHIVTCWKSPFFATGGNNGFLVSCHNWDTIFGSAHSVTVYWQCSETCNSDYNWCYSTSPPLKSE